MGLQDRQARNNDNDRGGPSSIDRRQTDLALLAMGSNLRPRTGPSTSKCVPPTPHEQEPSDNSVAPDRAQQNSEPITSVATKPAVDMVEESSDIFSSLNSIAEKFSAILTRDQTVACRQEIELLVPQVEVLAQSLGTPFSEGEVEERQRRTVLKWKLDSILPDLVQLEQRGRIARFLNHTADAKKLGYLAEDIRNAMMEYQTSLEQDIYNKSRQLIETTLLNGMGPAINAGYCSGNGQTCLEGTGVGVLGQLKSWLEDKQGHSAFWLTGFTGTGKSTIARTFAEVNFVDGNLGASFFCSRDSEDRSNLRVVFPTLAFQLADRHPEFREELLRTLKDTPDVGRESLCSQMEKIIVGPLKAAQIQTLIVIDALDQCKDEGSTFAILSVLSRYMDKIPQVKFFLTSRPEDTVHFGFQLESLRPVVEVFRLHTITTPSVDHDINLFFKTRLNGITKTQNDSGVVEYWSNSNDVNILCQKAHGSFFYASILVKFVTSERATSNNRLNLLIKGRNKKKRARSIDTLYVQVLEQAFCDARADDKFPDRFRSVIGALLLTFKPLPMEALSHLLGVSSIRTTLSSLHSILLVPSNDADIILVSQKSFSEFLTDKGQCKNKEFFINPSVHHREILLLCLGLMKKRLKGNICKLDDYTSLGKIEDLPIRRKAQIGDALEYACRFWTKHLVEIPSSNHDVEEIYKAINEFFTTRLLFWIEVLVITGNLDVATHSINDIRQWYTSAGLICNWLDDSQRLISEHIDVIHDSPSEIYHYALPLSPSSSWLQEYYRTELSGEVVIKGPPTDLKSLSRTVSFDHWPEVLVCWEDLITVGLSSDIIILDAIAGVRTSILSGHAGRVEALAFSPGGRFLVSGGDDKTIKFWNIKTGGVGKTLLGHTDRVCSVSISPDLAIIASGSDDRTLRLWDVQTGECRRTIHIAINSVSFSPTNPQQLISTSRDHIVRQWDGNGNQIGVTYEGDYIAFSSDGTRFVSLRKGVVTVRISNSGAIAAEFQVPKKELRYCCLSPDGKFAASVVYGIAYVWDVTSSAPRLTDTFVGHTKSISSLTFSSSSFVTSSLDGSIKLWQLGTSVDPVIIDRSSPPVTEARITSVSIQAHHGITISSDLAGVVKVWDISTGRVKESFDTVAGWFQWGDAEQIDGGFIFCWFAERQICLWDTREETPLRTIEVLSHYDAWDLKISGKGSKVFLLDHDHIRVWSMKGEVVGEVELEGKPVFNSLIVDGSRVSVRFEDSRIQVWDFRSPDSAPVPLSDISLLPWRRYRLDFIDCTRVWITEPSRIEDPTTGKEVFRLSGRYKNPTAVRWDGRYLVAGYRSGEVLILDLSRRERIHDIYAPFIDL